MTIPAAYLWRPSNARYVQIDGFVSGPRRPQSPCAAPLAWPAKDPGDTLDYVFDISPALTADPGDAIASLDITIGPANVGDLQLVSAAADGPRAILWLSGGQSQTNYTVTVTARTNGGRILVRTISLPVVALASLPTPQNALTTGDGLALTDPTGTPFTTI
ncbi:hypothetical protein [Acidocella sp.]|uniref:phage fiber-tail adaptor protein n=1 Tax=Acidocella sp. TaxID=50710 RepID=UPI002610FDD2|nr:hypothetical protein [Acidocella sp.]